MNDFEGAKGIASPAKRALAAAGVKSVSDLARFTEADVNHWHGVGPTVMDALKKLMTERNVSFRER